MFVRGDRARQSVFTDYCHVLLRVYTVHTSPVVQENAYDVHEFSENGHTAQPALLCFSAEMLLSARLGYDTGRI